MQVFRPALSTYATGRRASRASSRGFTLIEALVVVAMMAILAGLAAPSMIEFVNARQAETIARKIHADALFARSEAIKRDAPVLLCAGTTGACAAAPASTDWSAGWRVCYDRDGDGACDAGTSTDPNPLRVSDAVSTQVAFSGPTSRLQFNADGTMTAGGGAAFSATSGGTKKFKWAVGLAVSGTSSVKKEAV